MIKTLSSLRSPVYKREYEFANQLSTLNFLCRYFFGGLVNFRRFNEPQHPPMVKGESQWISDISEKPGCG
jgi:hypothetical protein